MDEHAGQNKPVGAYRDRAGPDVRRRAPWVMGLLGALALAVRLIRRRPGAWAATFVLLYGARVIVEWVQASIGGEVVRGVVEHGVLPIIRREAFAAAGSSLCAVVYTVAARQADDEEERFRLVPVGPHRIVRLALLQFAMGLLFAGRAEIPSTLAAALLVPCAWVLAGIVLLAPPAVAIDGLSVANAVRLSWRAARAAPAQTTVFVLGATSLRDLASWSIVSWTAWLIVLVPFLAVAQTALYLAHRCTEVGAATGHATSAAGTA